VVAIRVTGGGGATTLTDLTDVAGQTGPNKSPLGDPTGQLFTLTEVPTKADIDGILDGVRAVDWVYLDPLNGFRNYRDVSGDNWVPLRYRHNLNNIVHLEGVILPPDTHSIPDPVKVAVMPPETRSGYDLTFSADAQNGSIRFDLLADGSLMVVPVDSSGWLSLCGISWSVEAAA
jgi:hypothetical protein